MKHPHATLIADLGGAPALSERLGLKANATSNWLTRGVPWRYRNSVAKLAKKKRVPLPEGFLDALETEAA